MKLIETKNAVGQYTQKILKFYELDEESLAAAGSITYGSNGKEVTTQVSEATVTAASSTAPMPSLRA